MIGCIGARQTQNITVRQNHGVIQDILAQGIGLAAGKALPLHQGLLNFFDNAKSAFVATYRTYIKGDDFTMNVEYSSSIKPEEKVLIIADAVLATGASLKLVYDRLMEEGSPVHTHLVCPICSAYAVEHLQMVMPDNVTLWVAAIDEELTSHSYIVPGLGDAGDLAYREKSE